MSNVEVTQTVVDVSVTPTNVTLTVGGVASVTAGTGLTGGTITTTGTIAVDLAPNGGGTSTQAVRATDSRLSDARTPTAHAATHRAGGGDAVQLTQAQVDNLVTDLSGKVPTTRTITAGTGLTGGGDLTANRTFTVSYGTSAGTACEGNDARLSNTRTPTGAAGGDLGSTYPNPTVNAVTILVRNVDTVTIAKGKAVRLSGATGQVPNVVRAQANSYANSDVLGVTTTSIAQNATGRVILLGTLTGVDTSMFSDGQKLYLSPTVAGDLTATEPVRPDWQVQVAHVDYANNNGTLGVAPVVETTKAEYINDATATGEALLTAASAAAARSTLGLGEVALQGDGDKGDITVSASGATWTIDNGVVTYAKMQAVGTNILLGNDSSGVTIQDIPCTPAGRALIDDADAAAQRNTLGLGAVALQGDGDKGDITVSGSGATWTIDNGVVTVSKISATGSPSGTTFLRGDGAWATPTANVADGDKGDITVSGSGATWTLDPSTVTIAKISATGTPGSTTFLRGDGSWSIPEVVNGDKGDITVTNSGNTWTIDNGVVTVAKLSATGTPSASTFLRGDGSWQSVPALSDGDKGDITVASSGTVWTIDNGVVTVAKLSATGTPSASTFLRGDGSWASPTATIADGDKGDITVSSSGSVWTIDNGVVTVAKISATGSPSGSTFLRGDGAWATPTASVADGDKGDITVTASGATWTIDNQAVTYAKIQNVSATDRILGRDSAGAGVIEELTVGGGIEFTGTGGLQTSAFTGNVTKSAGGTSLTIANGVVAPAMLTTGGPSWDGSSNLTVTGDLTVSGNDIKSSTATAITMNGTDVSIAGDLTVTGNDIKSSSATAMSLSGADVSMQGNTSFKNYTEGVVAIGTVGASHTLDLTNGTVQTATLTSATACTFTMPTATAGKSFVLLIKQPASGSTTTATFTGVKWSGGTAPTITATLGRMDIISFFADGTNWYGSFVQNFTP